MEIIILILVMIFAYNLARGGLCIADFFVPGLGFSDEKLRRVKAEEPYVLSALEQFCVGFTANQFQVAEHIIMILDFFSYYYYKTNPSVFEDLYHYFRYDFIAIKRCCLKFLIVVGVLFLPVAIYESYEYGFPKEYFLVIPAICYSLILWYFISLNFEITITFVRDSWFLNAYYDIPEIELWIEYIYVNKNESYIVTKTRQIYNYIFVTESIDIYNIQSWEEYVYFDEDRKRPSFIKTFYNNYLWWLTPRPKKIKWPKWR